MLLWAAEGVKGELDRGHASCAGHRDEELGRPPAWLDLARHRPVGERAEVLRRLHERRVDDGVLDGLAHWPPPDGGA